MALSFPEDVLQADCEKAAQIMAEMTVWTLLDPESSDRTRLEVFSAYALVNCFIYPVDELELEHATFSRLVRAGGDDETAARLAGKVTDRDVRRYIFSLGFVRAEREAFGFHKDEKNKWLEPKKFIDSILKLENN